MKRRRCWTLAAMDPLTIVEEQQGNIATWPTSVKTEKFTEEPTAARSRRVAAIMYGNGVSVSEAVKCYRACNNAWRAVREAHADSCYFELDRGS